MKRQIKRDTCTSAGAGSSPCRLVSRAVADEPSRRRFLTDSAKMVAGSVLTGVALPQAYAGQDNTIRLALVGCGGREPGSADCSQNLHAYSIEYTFADGTKALVASRAMPDCYNDFATFVHGTKCAAQFSGNVHAPTVQIYKDQRTAKENIAWQPEREKVSPYQREWDVLLDAIRKDRPHNEVQRAAFTNLASIMGRAAVHAGKIITWEEVTASNFKFCPNVQGLTQDSPAPVQADAQGRYPVPVPGRWMEI